MLNVPAERSLNPTVLQVLRLIESVLATKATAYFLIGASARDILLYHVFGIPTTRATNDVDFAIALENWDQFERIKQLLLGTGRFTEVDGTAHRLFYDVEAHAYGYPLDFIPFGQIEDSAKQIAWPPDKQIVMNVGGYEDALNAAVLVRVHEDLVTKVVSIPGLAALKLFAWADRWREDRKDAQDLYFLLKQYASAGNQNRLYEHAFRLLEECGYDLDLAGAALLGFDCRKAMGTDTIIKMHAILDDRDQHDRLVLHMGARSDEGHAGADRWLRQFQRGLLLEELG